MAAIPLRIEEFCEEGRRALERTLYLITYSFFVSYNGSSQQISNCTRTACKAVKTITALASGSKLETMDPTEQNGLRAM